VSVKDEKMFRGRLRSFLYQKRSEQSEQKMNNLNSPQACSSRDRLSRARSRDSRHAITLEGKALVTPFGWNIKAESEDSARGPQAAAKPRPAGEMLSCDGRPGDSDHGRIVIPTQAV
jgi:hypothetical protein